MQIWRRPAEHLNRYASLRPPSIPGIYALHRCIRRRTQAPPPILSRCTNELHRKPYLIEDVLRFLEFYLRRQVTRFREFCLVNPLLLHRPAYKKESADLRHVKPLSGKDRIS